MAYQVLARRWRPAGFDEVCGQSHVTTPLRNAIRSDRMPHAILLTGPRGVGKTTIARILARCLNCEKGPTDEPCGSCESCIEVAGGSSTDVQEIDAASRTSVDDVREIIESVRYAPSPGKHRIYIVDEVHMLSGAAFNALLKTLEEPPPRSLFVFATTNPEKIPFTVVSRCQRYDLRRIASAEVAARLGEVARAEGVEVSELSLQALARAGEGSLRDSLTLFDQVLAAGGERVDDERVAEVLDLIDRRLLLEIAAACVDGDPASALEACARADASGVEARRLGGELIRTLRDLVVLRLAPNAPLVDAADADLAALREVAERCEPLRLRRMFRALVREIEDVAWAPEPFSVLEMAVVRLATLPASEDVATLLARIEGLERRLAGGGSGPGGSGGAGGGARPARPRADGVPPTRSQAATRGAEAGAPARTSPKPSPGSGTGATEAPAAAPVPEAAEQARSTAAAGSPEPKQAGAAAPTQVFDRLRGFAQEQNRGLFAGLNNARVLHCEPGKLHIALPPGIAARRLQSRVADLEAVCERFFGQATRVRLDVAEDPEAAAPGAESSDPEAARRQRKAALDHPAVNAALEILEGDILEIRPLGDAR